MKSITKKEIDVKGHAGKAMQPAQGSNHNPPNENHTTAKLLQDKAIITTKITPESGRKSSHTIHQEPLKTSSQDSKHNPHVTDRIAMFESRAKATTLNDPAKRLKNVSSSVDNSIMEKARALTTVVEKQKMIINEAPPNINSIHPTILTSNRPIIQPETEKKIEVNRISSTKFPNEKPIRDTKFKGELAAKLMNPFQGRPLAPPKFGENEVKETKEENAEKNDVKSQVEKSEMLQDILLAKPTGPKKTIKKITRPTFKSKDDK